MTRDDDDDDRCGYGKPPKRTRFKPGQSGNPRGRPRSVDFEQWENPIQKYMLETMTVTVKGKKEKMPVVDALIHTAIRRALGGCTKHLKILIDGSGGLRDLFQEKKRRSSLVTEVFLRELRDRAEQIIGDSDVSDEQRLGRGREDEKSDRRGE